MRVNMSILRQLYVLTDICAHGSNYTRMERQPSPKNAVRVLQKTGFRFKPLSEIVTVLRIVSRDKFCPVVEF